MKVEFFRHQLGEKNLQRFARVMESIFLTTGQEVALFEEKFADYLGQKYALGLMSATAGLHIPLLALGVGPGDEVITTPMTFVATPLAIMHTGAKPVFVDVEPETGNLDAELVAGGHQRQNQGHHAGAPVRADGGYAPPQRAGPDA